MLHAQVRASPEEEKLFDTNNEIIFKFNYVRGKKDGRECVRESERERGGNVSSLHASIGVVGRRDARRFAMLSPAVNAQAEK